jgi:hypothetical protein
MEAFGLRCDPKYEVTHVCFHCQDTGYVLTEERHEWRSRVCRDCLLGLKIIEAGEMFSD